ncbi:MAG TPA: tetratricopeptide repeat protein [Candidatus Acidoferrales bacterium]|nr:tetratricopeptide repeat protein [Candidatus Acidoferrales bacterium]
MAQHLSRKELKKDEVRETLAHGAEALLSHKQSTTYILIVAIILALGILGWRTYTTKQTAKAAAAFNDALGTFGAPTRTTPGAQMLPGAPAFNDDNAKYTAAAQQFETVAKNYSRTGPGQLAGYYAALSLEQIGKNDEAKKYLQLAAQSSNVNYASKAKFELAKLFDKTGQPEQATKLYEELVSSPTVLVPKPVAMLALAQHYREKDPTQAAKLYNQIKAQYPDTAVADEAGQELALLPGKS